MCLPTYTPLFRSATHVRSLYLQKEFSTIRVVGSVVGWRGWQCGGWRWGGNGSGGGDPWWRAGRREGGAGAKKYETWKQVWIAVWIWRFLWCAQGHVARFFRLEWCARVCVYMFFWSCVWVDILHIWVLATHCSTLNMLQHTVTHTHRIVCSYVYVVLVDSLHIWVFATHCNTQWFTQNTATQHHTDIQNRVLICLHFRV